MMEGGNMKFVEEKIVKRDSSRQYDLKKIKYESEKFNNIEYVYNMLFSLKNGKDFIFNGASAKDSYPLRDGGCIAECSSIEEIDEFINKVDKSEKEKGAEWERISILGTVNNEKISISFDLINKYIWVSLSVESELDVEKFLTTLEIL